jgi:hypothetical protein
MTEGLDLSYIEEKLVSAKACILCEKLAEAMKPVLKQITDQIIEMSGGLPPSVGTAESLVNLIGHKLYVERDGLEFTGISCAYVPYSLNPAIMAWLRNVAVDELVKMVQEKKP